MSVAVTNMLRLEPTKERGERTTLGITAIEITPSLTSLFHSCYGFIIGLIRGVITSPLSHFTS